MGSYAENEQDAREYAELKRLHEEEQKQEKGCYYYGRNHGSSNESTQSRECRASHESSKRLEFFFGKDIPIPTETMRGVRSNLTF